jgi:hypothetical protein
MLTMISAASIMTAFGADLSHGTNKRKVDVRFAFSSLSLVDQCRSDMYTSYI